MRDAPAQIKLQTLWDFVGYTPHASQLKVHLSDARYRVCVWGRRAGKSTCATMEALAAALTPGRRRCVWVVSPTYDLSAKIFRELQTLLQTHFKDLLKKSLWSDMHCGLTNIGGGYTEVRGKSAEKPESLIGEGTDLVIVDEAARIKASIWEEALSPTLVDRKGKALLISTPAGFNFFHQLWRRGQPGPDKDPDWESWRFPSTINPKLDPEEIEKERMRLPDVSFRQEYLADFASSEGAVFRNVRERALLAWPDSQGIPPVRPTQYDAGERYTAGLDVAQVRDWNVLCVLDSKRNVVHLTRWNKCPWNATVRRVSSILRLYNNAECFVDSTGIGSSVVEQLQTAGVRVRRYTLTNQSKADAINNLCNLLEKGELTLPRPQDCPVLIDELSAYSYTTTPTGVVKTSAPGAQHDDTVIGLALAAWGNRPDAIVHVRVSGGYDEDRPGEGQATGTGGIRVSSLGPEGAEFRYSLIDQIRKRY